MKRILAVLLVALAVSGCADKVIPVAQFYEKPEFVAPTVPPVSLAPLNWKVDSPDKVCLAPDDFKALLGNEKSMRDTITKLNSVIDAYKEYYKPHDKKASP